MPEASKMKWFRRSNVSISLTVALAAIVVAVVIPNESVGQAESTKNPKLRDNNYYYSAFNRRDPFRSLIVGDFISEKRMSPVDLGRVELVGIIRGDMDKFALLEDNKGFAYILRVGDRIKNGSVVAIGDRSMVARVTNFGQTRKFTLHLARAEGDRK
jgi:hypothetical protein